MDSGFLTLVFEEKKSTEPNSRDVEAVKKTDI